MWASIIMDLTRELNMIYRLRIANSKWLTCLTLLFNIRLLLFIGNVDVDCIPRLAFKITIFSS